MVVYKNGEELLLELLIYTHSIEKFAWDYDRISSFWSSPYHSSAILHSIFMWNDIFTVFYKIKISNNQKTLDPAVLQIQIFFLYNGNLHQYLVYYFKIWKDFLKLWLMFAQCLKLIQSIFVGIKCLKKLKITFKKVCSLQAIGLQLQLEQVNQVS